jgi:hypothetical protein
VGALGGASFAAPKSSLRRSVSSKALPVSFRFQDDEIIGNDSDLGDGGESDSGKFAAGEEFGKASSHKSYGNENERRITRRRTFHHVYYGSASADCSADPAEDSGGSGGWSPTNADRSPRQDHTKDPEIEEIKDKLRENLLQAQYLLYQKDPRVPGCGPKSAFRSLDLSGSGQLSLQEFTDGMKSLRVDWTVTKCKNLKEVYGLFRNKDGVVRLGDLFPDTRKELTDHRMSTPEFWNRWTMSTHPKKENPDAKREPKWHPADQDEEVEILFAAAQARESATDRKRWLSQTFRRMKSQGKSDARCRETCASHLPRGTGPRDREYVRGFCQYDVRACKKRYAEAVSKPARRIQKEVSAMREQRKELESAKLELRRMAQHQSRRLKQRRFESMARGSMVGFDDETEEECYDDENDEVDQKVAKELHGLLCFKK